MQKTALANNGFEEIAKTKNPGAMAEIFANECYKQQKQTPKSKKSRFGAYFITLY